MEKSPVNSKEIATLLTNALTDKIDDRKIYSKSEGANAVIPTILEKRVPRPQP